MPVSDIFAELTWRGLIHQTTAEDSMQAWLNEKPRSIYIGFDPTSDSLHVGSLMQVMTLRRFQRAGHRPIVLVGGATGMIGDPSGKSKERNLLSVDDLNRNVAGMQEQMMRLLDFDCGENSALLVNNFEWMQSFGYIEFLRDVGKNFPVNVMLAKDSVKNRLDRSDGGISYTEFSYMLLQAYDFVFLHDKYGCELQVGGSDQWGNVTAGIDLARRMRGVQLQGITCPLLTKADGTKMGKTESGAVWLAAEKTSPYAFYQYWVNVADDEAGKCLRLLTELEREEIEALDQSRLAEPHLRKSQKRLAEHLTELVHGAEGLSAARQATETLFGAEIDRLHDKELAEIFADVPSKFLPAQVLSDGFSLIDALVQSGLTKSKGEARRSIEQGGAYINNRRCSEIDRSLTRDDLASETMIVLRSGKRKYALLRFQDDA